MSCQSMITQPPSTFLIRASVGPVVITSKQLKTFAGCISPLKYCYSFLTPLRYHRNNSFRMSSPFSNCQTISSRPRN